MFIKSHALSPASLILSESCLSADFLAAVILGSVGWCKNVLPEILMVMVMVMVI